MECVRQSKDHNGIITLTVKYEDLLTRPDEIQNAIIVATGMKAVHSFSDYPNFIETTEQREKNYTFRPLDATKIEPDMKTYLQSPNDVKHFDLILKQLGY